MSTGSLTTHHTQLQGERDREGGGSREEREGPGVIFPFVHMFSGVRRMWETVNTLRTLRRREEEEEGGRGGRKWRVDFLWRHKTKMFGLAPCEVTTVVTPLYTRRTGLGSTTKTRRAGLPPAHEHQ
ncbi:unnamed protein product [Pleuronectes platessa]|uniref:Uncharacterized protein n=1 Tax=Pleuronectes platessa TaxID=8262 RepID=A0A9N7YWM5_PLEPL|nr:unnamed protein product [Pleuronectes platessa]